MSDKSRERGVELGDLRGKLQDETYPISRDELLEDYGDEEIQLSDTTTTLEEVIGSLGEDEFQDYSEVEGAVMNMVGDEAIGRKNYSDRTPPAMGEKRQDEGAPDTDGYSEQESF